MSLDLFHPLIRQWFTGRFSAPTEPQVQGWPHKILFSTQPTRATNNTP